jgi:carboxymethylenebutenolidase
MGEIVEFPSNGSTLKGYLARPADGGNGKGVIVIQEYWGLVPHIEQVTDRFAAAGFTALAPDLYRGKAASRDDEALSMLLALDLERAERDLRGAVDQVLRQPGVNGKVGVVGFCMGGQLALLAATTNPKVGATVDFYGIHPKLSPDFSRLSCPVLGLFAENDTFVTAEAVNGLVAAIQSAGGSIEAHIYPGVQHAFFNDSRPEVYDPTAAADAWRRTVDFVNRHL